MSHRDGTDYEPIICPVCKAPDFCRADCPELAAELARDLEREASVGPSEPEWLRILNEEG